MKKSVQIFVGGRELSTTKLLSAILFIASIIWFATGIIQIEPQPLKGLFLILTTGTWLTASAYIWQMAYPELYRNYNYAILIFSITVLASIAYQWAV